MPETLEKISTDVYHGVKFFSKFPEISVDKDPDHDLHWSTKQYVDKVIDDFQENPKVSDPLQAYKSLSPYTYSNTDLLAEDTAGYRVFGIRNTDTVRSVVIASANIIEGVILHIKDESGNAAVHGITVSVEEGQTIDGESEILLNQNYDSVDLLSDGSNLFTLSSSILITPDEAASLSPSPS